MTETGTTGRDSQRRSRARWARWHRWTRRARRRLPRPRVLVGLLAVVVLLLVVGTRTQRDHVDVGWAGEPTCGGVPVKPTDVSVSDVGEPAHLVPVVELSPGLDCTVPVRVRNGGWIPVSVRDVVVPFMGPGGGIGVQVVRLDGKPTHNPPYDPAAEGTPSVPGDSIDAAFERHRTLWPGGSDRFDLHLTYTPRGCVEAGGTSWVPLPRVTVRVLGLTGTRSAHEELGLQGTAASSDDCPRG